MNAHHTELPGYHTFRGWDFSLADDGDLEEVDNAILAWTEWRDFLLAREHAQKNAALDLEE